MGIRDRLSSHAESIAKAKVKRDQAINQRVSGRPAFLPDGWPEGTPYIDFGYGHGANAEPVRDSVTVRVIDADAPASRADLTDAQRAGNTVQSDLVARAAVARELAVLGGRS